MNRCWVSLSFAAGLLGVAACGGEFTSNASGTVGGNGGDSGAQNTVPGAGGANGGSGGLGNGSAGSLPGMGGGGGIAPGGGGGSAGRGGASVGGGSVVDASMPPVIDAAFADRSTSSDAKADAGNTTTPDASDAAMGCTPGALQCDAVPSRRCLDDRQWHDYHCGPLMLADVTAIDITKFLGFNLGFRCKTITVCGVAQNCFYSGEMLGSLESGEAMFYDGVALANPAAVKISLAVGAASQCMDPAVTIQAGESFVVVAGQQIKRIFLPAFSGTNFVFYVREDGATFKDQALTMLLQGPG